MERNRNKSEGFEHISRVIDRAINRCRKGPDMELAQIWDHWDRIVGEAVAENVQPAAFKGNILIVHVISSTWIHQLRFMKTEMISKLNKALGKDLVKEIKFKIGELK